MNQKWVKPSKHFEVWVRRTSSKKRQNAMYRVIEHAPGGYDGNPGISVTRKTNGDWLHWYYDFKKDKYVHGYPAGSKKAAKLAAEYRVRLIRKKSVDCEEEETMASSWPFPLQGGR